MGAANFVHGASCHLELIHASEGAALLSLCAPARPPVTPRADGVLPMGVFYVHFVR